MRQDQVFILRSIGVIKAQLMSAEPTERLHLIERLLTLCALLDTGHLEECATKDERKAA
jgi:hypothetical protein